MKIVKKLLSLAMASALALSLAAPAFAAAGSVTADNMLAAKTEKQFEVEMEGMVYVPTLRLQVLTTSQKLYVNPSKNPVSGTIEGFLEGDAKLKYKFEQKSLISTPIMIRSDTDNKLNVAAKVTVTPVSSVTLAADDSAVSGIANKTDGTQKTTKAVAIGVKGTNDLGAKAAAADLKVANFTMPATGGNVATDTKTVTVEKACHIGKAVTEYDPDTGEATSVTPQYGGIILVGSANEKADWTDSDTISASVILTFSVDSEPDTPAGP